MSDRTAQETAWICLLIIPNMACKTLSISLLAVKTLFISQFATFIERVSLLHGFSVFWVHVWRRTAGSSILLFLHSLKNSEEMELAKNPTQAFSFI